MGGGRRAVGSGQWAKCNGQWAMGRGGGCGSRQAGQRCGVTVTVGKGGGGGSGRGGSGEKKALTGRRLALSGADQEGNE